MVVHAPAFAVSMPSSTPGTTDGNAPQSGIGAKYKDPVASKTELPSSDDILPPKNTPANTSDSETETPSKPIHKKKTSKATATQEDSKGVLLSDLKRNAPDSYTVVKGDTLWDISGRFLKKPWMWPKLWHMNRKDIKNPHLIYPGDHLFLIIDANGRIHLAKGRRLDKFQGRFKLSPHVRVESLANEPIPTISPSEIAPFLSKPLVVNPGDLDSAPKILGSLDERVILGQGDIAYVKGMPNDGNEDQTWQIYRPGRALTIKRIDAHGDLAPIILGYEAIHLGDAKVRKQSEGVSSVEIIKARQEITKGDRLVLAPSTAPMNYVPRAPEREIEAQIISLPEGVAETGRNNIVAISAGSMEGVEIGHVLAIHHEGKTIKVPDELSEIKLPNERVGLLMVFRVFDNVSYALIMGSERQIQVGDLLRLP